MANAAPLNQSDRDYLLQRFVEDLPDCAIIVLDVDGNVQSWNAGARSMLGYLADEVVGQPFWRLCAAEDLVAALRDALERGRHEANTGFTRKDGTRISARGVLFPLYNARDSLMGFGVLIHDLVDSVRTSAGTDIADLAARRGAPLILVVDDDDDVRRVAVRQLTSLGYRVIDRSNGADALQTLTEVSDIALLFVDVMMPNGLSGREVAERARELRPDVKILFASGYFEGALVSRGEIDSNVDFLVKPYRKKDLAEKIQEVLGTPSN